ncbi:hypothetical protein LJ739_09605 [Aestuariibacter halophilus]|uniref:Uncharacterized protein n=1 Tax=Fluctibacter halophilus TaxID=226011 RepID=A0ABS8G7H2_9ALTE|nr:hypothetical protein [Aestuariibacter halophilus]MCC2616495.1 hypothetical protein [Aestuariibacter halophilus]
MNDNPATKELIFESTAPLRDALDNRVYWQWDKHYNALLAEFSVDHEQQVLMTVKQFFKRQWDNKTIRQAPPEVRHRAHDFARLDKKQLLMVSDEPGCQDIMLAWWPWGHGATISMRIFRADDTPYEPPSGVMATIKSWFSH